MFGGESIIFIALAIIAYSLTFFYCSVESVMKYIGILVTIGWFLAIPKFSPAVDRMRLMICPYSMRTYLWIGGQTAIAMILGELTFYCKTHFSLVLYLLLLVFMNIKGFSGFAWFAVPKHPESSSKK